MKDWMIRHATLDSQLAVVCRIVDVAKSCKLLTGYKCVPRYVRQEESWDGIPRSTKDRAKKSIGAIPTLRRPAVDARCPLC